MWSWGSKKCVAKSVWYVHTMEYYTAGFLNRGTIDILSWGTVLCILRWLAATFPLLLAVTTRKCLQTLSTPVEGHSQTWLRITVTQHWERTNTSHTQTTWVTLTNATWRTRSQTRKNGACTIPCPCSSKPSKTTPMGTLGERIRDWKELLGIN